MDEIGDDEEIAGDGGEFPPGDFDTEFKDFEGQEGPRHDDDKILRPGPAQVEPDAFGGEERGIEEGRPTEQDKVRCQNRRLAENPVDEAILRIKVIRNDDVGVEKLNHVMMPEMQESKSHGGEESGVKQLPAGDKPQDKIFPRGNSIFGC